MLRATDERMVSVIMANRSGKLKIKPGYDGVYGEIVLDGIEKLPDRKQSSLKDFS